MTLSDLLLRLRALLFRARVEEELEDEVEFHLAMACRKHLDAGHTEEEASRLARLDFGRVGCGEGRLSGRARDRSFRDRAARHSICAQEFPAQPGVRAYGRRNDRSWPRTQSGALYSLQRVCAAPYLDTRSLQPLRLHVDRPSRRGHAFSWDEYQQFEKDNPAFSEVAAVQYIYTRVDGHVFQGQLVTGNYFQMLGVARSWAAPCSLKMPARPGAKP